MVRSECAEFDRRAVPGAADPPALLAELAEASLAVPEHTPNQDHLGAPDC